MVLTSTATTKETADIDTTRPSTSEQIAQDVAASIGTTSASTPEEHVGRITAVSAAEVIAIGRIAVSAATACTVAIGVAVIVTAAQVIAYTRDIMREGHSLVQKIAKL